MSSRASLAILAILASLATLATLASLSACGAAPAPAAPFSTAPPRSPASGASATGFHAVVLAGRHEVRSLVMGPKERLYAATMDDLFVFPADSSASGEHFRFRGDLVATSDGAHLYRSEGKELFEIDATGADLRRLAFTRPIESVTPSPTGALLAVTTFEGSGAQATKRVTIVRAAELQEVAHITLPFGREEVTWSPDGERFASDSRVIEARTGKITYQHANLFSRVVLFEGTRRERFSWIFRNLLTTVDLEKGTETLTWLPCAGETRADPEAHRFVTRCPSEIVLTNVAGIAPVITHPPSGDALADPIATGADVQNARMAKEARFSRSTLWHHLMAAPGMALRDGEVVIPPKEDSDRIAVRVRLAPAAHGAAAAKPQVDVRNGHIIVHASGGAPLADILFNPPSHTYAPDPHDVVVAFEKVVVSRRAASRTDPATDVYLCSFAGTCVAKFEKDRFLGVFGDEIAASHVEGGDVTLVRESLITGARIETPMPGFASALARSEDGSFYIATNTPRGSPKTTFTRIDAPMNKVTGVLDVENPSYASSPLLGIVGERMLLEPDLGNWGRVILLDARSFEEKEQYLFGGNGSILHVREDGTYETTGDAARIENAIVCTDGKHFVPAATCRRAPP